MVFLHKHGLTWFNYQYNINNIQNINILLAFYHFISCC